MTASLKATDGSNAVDTRSPGIVTRISDAGAPKVSFEFFPPKTPAMAPLAPIMGISEEGSINA